MSKYRNQILLLCPAALKDAANAAAEATLGSGHANTFSAGYSATGEAPATHYAARSAMTDGMAAQLGQLAAAFPTIQAWLDGPADFSGLAGLPQAHVGAFDPHAVFAGLGLRAVG